MSREALTTTATHDDVSTPLVTGSTMTTISRFTVETAQIKDDYPQPAEEPAHSINGAAQASPHRPSGVDLIAPIRLLKTPREIKLKFTVMCLFICILVGTILILVYYKEDPFHYVVGSLIYYVDKKAMVITYEGRDRLRGQMGLYAPLDSPATCSFPRSSDNLCLRWRDYGRLEIACNDSLGSLGIDCYKISWETDAPEHSIKDCFSVKNSHWYGGSVRKDQKLPLESMDIPLTAFITSDREDQFGSVVERYWLSSQIISVKVEEGSPLLVSIDNNAQELCIESKFWDSFHYHHNTTDAHLQYTICTGRDMVELFNYTKKFPIPENVPEEPLLSEPIWSLDVTNGTMPFEIMKDIREFYPHGLVDVRSGFNTNEGDLTFENSPISESFIAYVHSMNMAISVSVTPFVSVDSAAFKRGTLDGHLVKDPRGEVPGLTMWGNQIGGVVDLTDSSAKSSYQESLQDFQQSRGLSRLTFDYGESSYLPYGYQISTELDDPSQFTHEYVNIANAVAGTVIARSAYKSQGIPMIVRTYPKEGSWDMENGLASVVPSIINLGLMGYPYMALDLREFSGNVMDRRLFMGYMQLSACLPVMQIPTDLFEYDSSDRDIIRGYIDFHKETIFPKVEALSREFLATGLPLLRPIWWVNDADEVAMINSQFLVGDDLLVAPGVENVGETRQVYIPAGVWDQPGTGLFYPGCGWRDVYFRPGKIPYLRKTTTKPCA